MKAMNIEREKVHHRNIYFLLPNQKIIWFVFVRIIEKKEKEKERTRVTHIHRLEGHFIQIMGNIVTPDQGLLPLPSYGDVIT
jgi:hypothetical protein